MANNTMVGCGEARTAPFAGWSRDRGGWCGSFVTTPYQRYRQMAELEKLDAVIREKLGALGYAV